MAAWTAAEPAGNSLKFCSPDTVSAACCQHSRKHECRIRMEHNMVIHKCSLSSALSILAKIEIEICQPQTVPPTSRSEAGVTLMAGSRLSKQQAHQQSWEQSHPAHSSA